MPYKLSSLAEEDIEGIYEYTLLNFGKQQALAYADDLHNILNDLADSLLTGADCPEIAEGVWRHYHQRHAIFYRRRKSDILVIRILHQQMKVMKHIIDL